MQLILIRILVFAQTTISICMLIIILPPFEYLKTVWAYRVLKFCTFEFFVLPVSHIVMF